MQCNGCQKEITTNKHGYCKNCWIRVKKGYCWRRLFSKLEMTIFHLTMFTEHEYFYKVRKFLNE